MCQGTDVVSWYGCSVPNWIVCSGHCTASTCSGRVHFLLWGIATHSSQMTLGRTCSWHAINLMMMMISHVQKQQCILTYVLIVHYWCAVAEQTEFRFFWLQTKLQETPDVCRVSKTNPVSCCWFHCLLAFSPHSLFKRQILCGMF